MLGLGAVLTRMKTHLSDRLRPGEEMFQAPKVAREADEHTNLAVLRFYVLYLLTGAIVAPVAVVIAPPPGGNIVALIWVALLGFVVWRVNHNLDAYCCDQDLGFRLSRREKLRFILAHTLSKEGKRPEQWRTR